VGEHDGAIDALVQEAFEKAFPSNGGQLDWSRVAEISRHGKREQVRAATLLVNGKARTGGAIIAVAALKPISERLESFHQAGFQAYIVDRAGGLIASSDPSGKAPVPELKVYPAFENASRLGFHTEVTETAQYNLRQDGTLIPMLGTVSSIPNLHWVLIIQRRLSDSYGGVAEARRSINALDLVMAGFSIAAGLILSRWLIGAA
jgi:hypothetical protein